MWPQCSICLKSEFSFYTHSLSGLTSSLYPNTLRTSNWHPNLSMGIRLHRDLGICVQYYVPQMTSLKYYLFQGPGAFILPIRSNTVSFANWMPRRNQGQDKCERAKEVDIAQHLTPASGASPTPSYIHTYTFRL